MISAHSIPSTPSATPAELSTTCLEEVSFFSHNEQSPSVLLDEVFESEEEEMGYSDSEKRGKVNTYFFICSAIKFAVSGSGWVCTQYDDMTIADIDAMKLILPKNALLMSKNKCRNIFPV